MFSLPRWHYSRIADKPDGASDFESESCGSESPSKLHNVWFLWLPALICILCTLTTSGIVIYFANPVSPLRLDASSLFPRNQMHTLHRPSSFIGFDKIQLPPPRQTEIVNFPQVVAQVSQRKPDKVFSDDTRRYSSSIGTVNPEDRQVRVTTEDISTIVQFMAIDYAMELCELRLHVEASSLLGLDGPTTLVVNRLNTSQHLDPQHLSYNTRPRVEETLAHIELDPALGVQWSRLFPCAMHEILTFELGCWQSDYDGPEKCFVNWWQDKERTNPGKCHCTIAESRELIFDVAYVISILYDSTL